jgi:hypothetical protein
LRYEALSSQYALRIGIVGAKKHKASLFPFIANILKLAINAATTTPQVSSKGLIDFAYTTWMRVGKRIWPLGTLMQSRIAIQAAASLKNEGWLFFHRK